MSSLVEHLMSNEMVLDGALAQDTTQSQAFWALRETITESIGKSGKVYKYDLSVPLEQMYGLVEKMRIRLKEKGYLKDDGSGEVIGCLGFGHMGDGQFISIYSVRFWRLIKRQSASKHRSAGIQG
jgi:FAD/FMN-containing dehydrogenase